jgi:hypothetical protein
MAYSYMAPGSAKKSGYPPIHTSDTYLSIRLSGRDPERLLPKPEEGFAEVSIKVLD